MATMAEHPVNEAPALNGAPTTASDLDRSVGVTPVAGWALLGLTVLLLFLGGLWSITGQVPKQTTLTAAVIRVTPDTALTVAIMPADQLQDCPVGARVSVVARGASGRETVQSVGTVTADAQPAAGIGQMEVNVPLTGRSPQPAPQVGEQVTVTCTNGVVHPIDLLVGSG